MDGLERFRVELAASRRDGVAFPTAWRRALRDAHPTSYERYGLSSTRTAWEAAYCGKPEPPLAAALGRLAHDDRLSGPRVEHQASRPSVEQRIRISAESDRYRFSGG